MYLVYYNSKVGEHFTIERVRKIIELNAEEIKVTYTKDMNEVERIMKKEDISSVGIVY